MILDNQAFIVHDIDSEEKEISKAAVTETGNLKSIQKSSLEDMEKVIANIKSPDKVFIKEGIFEDLKKLFGKDVEVLVNF